MRETAGALFIGQGPIIERPFDQAAEIQRIFFE